MQPEPVHDPAVAVPPEAPTVTDTDTLEPTADDAVATTRTVWAPSSSPTAVSAPSEVSVKLRAMVVVCALAGGALRTSANPNTTAANAESLLMEVPPFLC